MGYKIKALVNVALDARASDIHLHAGEPPALRVDGDISPMEGPALTPEDTLELVKSICGKEQIDRLNAQGEVDFAVTFEGIEERFRTNIFKSEGNYNIVLRIIPHEMLSLEDIGLPESIKDIIRLPRGLVLVTGPTGSGKTTTLAAMLNWINENVAGHIVTIEDPVEYLHQSKRCIVNQREVGVDTNSFLTGLISSLRQDPDVILLGEMRDLATIEAAVTAAETGHLVLATLHTTGAPRTVDRIIDAFPVGSKDMVRMQLASNLRAVISQVLCRKKDEDGRVAAFEIMVRTDAISSLIRENKTFRIASEIDLGSKHGMISLDRHLLYLYTEGRIDRETALEQAELPNDLEKLMGESVPGQDTGDI